MSKKKQQEEALIEEYHYQSSKVFERLKDIAERAVTEIELADVGSLVQAIANRDSVRDRIESFNCEHKVSLKFYPGVAD